MKKLSAVLGAAALLALGFTAGLLCNHPANAKEVSTDRITASLSDNNLNETTVYSLENCVSVFDESKVQPNASGYAYWFVKQGFAQDGVDLKMSYVDKAQATHPPHRHDNEEIFYVLEGEVIVHLDGEEIKLGPRSALYCPKGSYHGIRRAGEQPARYLVINNHGIGRNE